jgi:hypothetical protein
MKKRFTEEQIVKVVNRLSHEAIIKKFKKSISR